MKITLGIAAGITLSILAYTVGWQWLAWFMCRVTDWALIAATTTVENIGTGTTAYLLEGNDNQPVHVMTGLFRYASERVIWDDSEDDDE